MYYYIYKTTNVLNGMFYIGLHHSTRPFDPNYMGSGLHVKRAIKAYGKHNFTVEVLHYCDSAEELSTLEAQLVTEALVLDPQCYNLRTGGRGGSTKGSLSEESRKAIGVKTTANLSGRPGHKHTEATKEKLRNKVPVQHTTEMRQQMSLQRAGRKLKVVARIGNVWWNDGVTATRAKECPGPQWARGRI